VGLTMSMSTGTLRTGSLLSKKYRLERVLGVGGMGVVWEAYVEPSGERVAVKVLSQERASDERLVRRFLYEARAAAKLRSNHVARLCEVGALDDGVPFLVMELLAGVSLSRYLRLRGPLPPGEAVEWVSQACDALIEAHGMGIVHRDLKPANLFLADNADGSRIVKVLDFGIAKRLDGTSIEATTQGSLLGSPSYMAPEQISAPAKVDTRADVWALGIILYELIAGQKPFCGVSLPETLAQVLHADPPALLELCPSLPAGLASIVHGCLEKDRDRRIDSAESLARALTPFRVEEKLVCPPSEPSTALDSTRALLTPYDPNAPTRIDNAIVPYTAIAGDDEEEDVPPSSMLETLVAATRRSPLVNALPKVQAPPPPPSELPAWPLPCDEDSDASTVGQPLPLVSDWPTPTNHRPLPSSAQPTSGHPPFGSDIPTTNERLPLNAGAPTTHERRPLNSSTPPGNNRRPFNPDTIPLSSVLPSRGDVSPFAFVFPSEKTAPLSVVPERRRPASNPPSGYHHAAGASSFPPPSMPSTGYGSNPAPAMASRGAVNWPDRNQTKLGVSRTAFIAASLGWGVLAVVLLRQCASDTSGASLPTTSAPAVTATQRAASKVAPVREDNARPAQALK
jgi:eukaryotic-like serine/threonine-protein kinase